LVSDSRILVSDSRVLVSDSLLLIRGKLLTRGSFVFRNFPTGNMTRAHTCSDAMHTSKANTAGWQHTLPILSIDLPCWNVTIIAKHEMYIGFTSVSAGYDGYSRLQVTSHIKKKFNRTIGPSWTISFKPWPDFASECHLLCRPLLQYVEQVTVGKDKENSETM